MPQQKGTSSSAESTSARIRKNCEEIIQLWERKVRAEVEAATQKSPVALRNAIGQILEGIARTLDTPPTLRLVQLEKERKLAEEHGEQRSRLGDYSIEEVVHEYFILRQVLFQFLEDEQPLDSRERDLILDSIHLAVESSVGEFVERTQHVQGQANAASLRARKEAEASLAALDALVASAPIGVAFLDSDLRYLKVNEPLARSNGVPVADHLGRTAREVIPDAAPFIEPIARQVLTSGKPVLNLELSKDRFGGWKREGYYLANYFPVFDAAGAIVGLGAVLIDITARRRIELDHEKLLSESQENLRRLKAEKELRERFVHTLTHDLRGPLTAIKSSIQMLRRYPEKVDARDRLFARIEANADRADSMIQDLLDASLLEAGQKLPLQIQECDLDRVAQNVVEEMAFLHGDRFVYHSMGPLFGYWSSEGLRRVLENLITNAVKYGARDQIITIAARADAQHVELSVRNLGDPISPEDQKHLFQPFRRVASAQTRASSGWGLGLTLVRGIVDAHGGSVRVTSSVEDGTQFMVSLPRDARQYQ